MPFALLIALFLAFGFDLPSEGGASNQPPIDPRLEAGVMLVGWAVVALAATVLGRGIVRGLIRDGGPTPALRRHHAWGVRFVDALALVVYAGMIHGLDWPLFVRSALGLKGVLLAEDVVILLPFLVLQLTAWSGLFPAERALRTARPVRGMAGLGRHLGLKARQTLGLVLPVVLVFSVGQDLACRQWPGWAEGPWAQPVSMALLAAGVLVGAPLLVRLAWPTRPLPPGPLRTRLERQARRLGFRCTNILVWDTGHTLVNAGVTGAWPWFRYVLLTDALIDSLDEHEIAAVFGHEIGHIAHRHMAFFGVFLLGSLGVMALVGGAIEQQLAAVPIRWLGASGPAVLLVVEAAATILALGFYFLIVFGFLSRRFERQADVFGCKAVSCGQADCPPHADHDRSAAARLGAPALCPVGIQIFARALSNVANLNGMEPRARSWRHGSIARRIAFLEGLRGQPEAERRFQRGVSWLRIGLLAVLAAAFVTAWSTGAIEHLR